MGAAHAAQGSGSGQGVRSQASLDFAVRIAPTLRFGLTGQPRSVKVSARDAAAGEVVVSGARLELLSNERRGVVLRAAVARPFVGATIEGLGAPLDVTEQGVRMAVMTRRDGTGEFRLRYRLRLGAGSAPGSYPWPVALSLEAP
jgi:hypothetical protein